MFLLRAARKTIADQIKTIPVLAETKNTNVGGGNPQVVVIVTLTPQNAYPPS